jgi:exonuclease SbcD
VKILHFADLHLGVETYGRPDPATGLSSRLSDFLSAFDRLVDYVLNNKVDLVLFCGDAYKSREPSQTQQREFARRINRLAANNIFDTLAVQNVYVANRPDIYRIPTASGEIQVAALPWLRRSSLLSREDTKELNFEGINEKLQQILTGIITDFTDRLDPTLPAVLAAHVWVAGATAGSEKSMTLGQEHALLLSNVANPAFDYVALGHIHKQQVLSESPPTVYAGSLERLDFGEEADDKGFYVVDIQSDQGGDKREVHFQFQPIEGRPFLTISLTLDAGDTDPTTTVVRAITAQANRVADAIVRLQLTLPAEVEGQLSDAEVRNALKEAHYFTIAKDIKRETRLRLGNWTAEEITPVEALKAYLEQKKVSPARARTMMEYGERLISGETEQDEGEV